MTLNLDGYPRPQTNAHLDPPGKASGVQGSNTNQGLVTSGVCISYKLLLSQAETFLRHEARAMDVSLRLHYYPYLQYKDALLISMTACEIRRACPGVFPHGPRLANY